MARDGRASVVGAGCAPVRSARCGLALAHCLAQRHGIGARRCLVFIQPEHVDRLFEALCLLGESGCGTGELFDHGRVLLRDAIELVDRLVHLRDAPTLPDYRLIEVRFEESFVEAIDINLLPRNWRANRPPEISPSCDHHEVRLRDRAGMEHTLKADVGCRNTLFNAAQQSAAEAVPMCMSACVPLCTGV